MPAPYQLASTFPGQSVPSVQRIADGAFIPFDPANRDYQEYLQWLEAGNEPDPAPDPQSIQQALPENPTPRVSKK